MAQMPPFEFFLNVKDKRKAWAHRLTALKQGDIIYTQVTRLLNGNRLLVKPLCSGEPKHAYLADIPIKVKSFDFLKLKIHLPFKTKRYMYS